jgi:hypothetical protein
MAQTLTMQLCNINSAKVDWVVTPDGGQPVLITQDARQYGSIQVPMASRYLIVAGNHTKDTTDPSIQAVFTGDQLVLCQPA